MTDEKNPLFSVVICDHDRKQYIKDAVESVLSQDISRSMFEVLVVKNYLDEDIDRYLDNKGVKSIFTSVVPLSQKMAKGIENSIGQYICFLDDDDLFGTGKLSRILAFIEKYGRISFYHNSFITINESGKINSKVFPKKTYGSIDLKNAAEIKKNAHLLLRYRCDWYASMMCINREIVLSKISVLSNSSASADRLLFLIGISNGIPVICDFEPNTFYRIHESLTTTFLSFNDFMKRRENFYKKSLESFRSAYSLLRNTYSNEVLEMFLVHEEIMIAFTGFNEKYNLVNFFKNVFRYSIKMKKIEILVWYNMLILKKFLGLPTVRLYYLITLNRLRKASK